MDKYQAGYDAVCGMIKNRHGESAMRRILPSLFYDVISAFAGAPFPGSAGYFHPIDSTVVPMAEFITALFRPVFYPGVIIGERRGAGSAGG